MEKLSEILNDAGVELLEPVFSASSHTLVLTVDCLLASKLYFLNLHGLNLISCRPYVDEQFPKGCLWITLLIKDGLDLEIDC